MGEVPPLLVLSPRLASQRAALKCKLEQARPLLKPLFCAPCPHPAASFSGWPTSLGRHASSSPSGSSPVPAKDSPHPHPHPIF